MNGTTIMICDDNETVHQTLQLYLKDAGFRVVSAYDGIAAVYLICVVLGCLIIWVIPFVKNRADLLEIAAEIARGLNEKLWVESEFGKGAAFYFTISY